MINLKHPNVIFCGDIHGEIRELVFKLENNKITDSNVIICGDCGIGFEKENYYLDNLYNRIKYKLKNLNTTIYGIRGNHDDPEYFNGSKRIDLEYFKTIPDYSILTLPNGFEILCIGGATSVDQAFRKEVNAKLASKKRPLVWWDTERPIKKDIQDLPTKIDCIVSHEAPMQADPVLLRDENMGLDVHQNIVKDRDYLGNILKEIKPSFWFYGHHHISASGTWGDTRYQCLNIQELFDAHYIIEK